MKICNAWVGFVKNGQNLKIQQQDPKSNFWGSWLAQLVEPVLFDLEVVSSSLLLGVELT